jgi:hypothetical protein
MYCARRDTIWRAVACEAWCCATLSRNDGASHSTSIASSVAPRAASSSAAPVVGAQPVCVGFRETHLDIVSRWSKWRGVQAQTHLHKGQSSG